jgi:hypothetical protein
LEHGTYDDCEGLTEEEVNIFYNFHENGELHSDDEDPDQSDNEEDSLDEEFSEGDSTDSMDVNESEDMQDSDHGFGTEVCCSYNYLT